MNTLKMNASKENAQAIGNLIRRIIMPGDDLKQIEKFLDACQRRLPTEDTIKRNAQRRRKSRTKKVRSDT